ncbi:MAG: hypothetical protein WHT07_10755 [Desulfobaccales bacterium]
MTSWRKMVMAGMMCTGLAFASLPAWGEISSPWIDQRELRQQERIYQGVASGQITPREFYRLERQHNRILAAEARMKADGYYNRRERLRTHQMLDRASQSIYRAKHNRRIR